MKKAILAALIAATALAPIAASAQEWRGRGGGDRGGHARTEQPRGNGGNGGGFQRSGQRPNWSRPSAPTRSFDNGGRRFDRPQAQSRPQFQGRQQFQARPQFGRSEGQSRAFVRSGGSGGDGSVRRWQGSGRPDYRRDGNRPLVNATPNAQRGDRDWNRGDRQGDRRNWTSQRRDWNRDDQRRGDWNRRDGDRRSWDRNDRNRGNWDRRDWDRRDWDRRGSWNRGWRNDNRYNWRDWRSHNRYAYRLPRYYAPHGWDYGYRRYGIGVTLSALLFAQNYWIDDPWEYRLPPAYGPYRWVRYYNDALLVDIDSGEVVDVIYDIFW